MRDFRAMRHGRLPHDPERLARAPRLDGHVFALAPPPAALARGHVAYAPQMDDNDKVGDCGAVGLANGARAVAALRGNALDIATAAVLAFYARMGYRLGPPVVDPGMRLLDALAAQAAQAWMAKEQLPLTGPFASFDPADRMMAARAMDQIGWAYCGFALALSDQRADVWDTETPASAGDPTPGSWACHCMDLLYYDGLSDTDLVYLATWGMIQRATWRWVQSRMDEAHVVIWRLVAGIDYDRLRADCAAFVAP